MKVFYFNNTTCYDAEKNLALEEALFNQYNLEDPILFFWQNENAVIIGRNQVTQNEIDQNFIDQNSIQVVRRNTGGGAVFHDLGNLNYSIITKKADTNFKFNDILLKVFSNLGLNAYFSGRNDLLIDGLKISGNSVYEKGKKVLSHGTLLFSIDKEKVNSSLTPNKIKLLSKGIRSTQSRIGNLIDFIPDLTIEQFINEVINVLEEDFDLKKLDIDPKIKDEADKLYKEKYHTRDWNYNKNFNYNFSNTVKFDNGLLTVNIKVKDQKIKAISFTGDFFQLKELKELEKKFNNKELNDLEDITKDTDISKYILGLDQETFVNLFRGIHGF